MGMDKSEVNRLSQLGSANLASHYHNCLSASIHKSVDVTVWFLTQRHYTTVSLSLQLSPLTSLCNSRYVLTSAKEKARWNQHGIAQGANIIKTLLFTETLSVRKAQVITYKISAWTYSLLSFPSSGSNSLYFCKLILCLHTENEPAVV